MSEINYALLIEDAMQTLNAYRGMRDWGQLTDKDVEDAYKHFINKLKLLPEGLPVDTVDKTSLAGTEIRRVFIRNGSVLSQTIEVGENIYFDEINLGE